MAHLGHLVARVDRSERDGHAGPQRSVEDPDGGHGAEVLVIVRVEDQRPKRGVGVAAGRRHPRDDGLEHMLDPRALLCRNRQHQIRVDPHQLGDFLSPALGFRARQIDLVEDRDDSEVGVQGQNRLDRVCACTPWVASTTRIAPSHAASERDTS